MKIKIKSALAEDAKKREDAEKSLGSVDAQVVDHAAHTGTGDRRVDVEQQSEALSGERRVRVELTGPPVAFEPAAKIESAQRVKIKIKGALAEDAKKREDAEKSLGSVDAQVVDHAAHTGTEDRRVEVEQQSEALSGEPQVRVELKRVYWHQLVDALDLDDDEVLDEEVEAIGVAQHASLVVDRKVQLPLEAQPAQLELVSKDLFVRRLQEPRSEKTMHFDGSADDGPGTLVLVTDSRSNDGSPLRPFFFSASSARKLLLFHGREDSSTAAARDMGR